jgi:hypothetical protein
MRCRQNDNPPENTLEKFNKKLKKINSKNEKWYNNRRRFGSANGKPQITDSEIESSNLAVARAIQLEKELHSIHIRKTYF